MPCRRVNFGDIAGWKFSVFYDCSLLPTIAVIQFGQIEHCCMLENSIQLCRFSAIHALEDAFDPVCVCWEVQPLNEETLFIWPKIFEATASMQLEMLRYEEIHLQVWFVSIFVFFQSWQFKFLMFWNFLLAFIIKSNIIFASTSLAGFMHPDFCILPNARTILNPIESITRIGNYR